MAPSRAIKLYGTEEPVEAPILLKAGALTAEFSAGNLRYIRINGKEALRAIAFLVRDRNWGTYNAVLSNLKIESAEDMFAVTYDGETRDAEQALTYSARIEGHADGTLLFEAEGRASTDFETNRTGFVVLHALEGIVGAPVTVEHTDGRIAESRFPEEIDPACPFQDVRALTHSIAPGVSVHCRMEGDAFEMEDHRNWMDASYKTYVRPLALPWPYTISKDDVFTQRVSLTVEGKMADDGAASGNEPVTVTIGGPLVHTMPPLGLAVPPEHAADARAEAGRISAIKPSFLVCHFDARKGHDAATMAAFRDLGAAVGVDLVLEAVLPCLDAAGNPTDNDAVLDSDIEFIRVAAADSGVSFSRVAVSPSSDLKCTLPGSVFPPAPSWEALISAARSAFPSVPVGGGMFSYFTELNRKRPPAGVLDFICHTGSPIVHAGDDVSVMETLEALPSIFGSVRAFGGGKPYHIFPTAIAMRDNPYGAAPAENPDNIRQAMNRVDPRERGLIGSAWYAGYLAHALRAGIDALTLATVAGPSGIVSTRQDHVRPWFDETTNGVMPTYHLFAAFAGCAGQAVHAADSSDGTAVQAAAVACDGGVKLMIANLKGSPVSIRLDGLDGEAHLRILDASSFETACQDPDGFSAAMVPLTAPHIDLDSYAVAFLEMNTGNIAQHGRP